MKSNNLNILVPKIQTDLKRLYVSVESAEDSILQI
jgi:hypothetical protein